MDRNGTGIVVVSDEYSGTTLIKALKISAGLYDMFMAPNIGPKLATKSFSATDQVSCHVLYVHATEKAIIPIVPLVKGLDSRTPQSLKFQSMSGVQMKAGEPESEGQIDPMFPRTAGFGP